MKFCVILSIFAFLGNVICQSGEGDEELPKNPTFEDVVKQANVMNLNCDFEEKIIDEHAPDVFGYKMVIKHKNFKINFKELFERGEWKAVFQRSNIEAICLRRGTNELEGDYTKHQFEQFLSTCQEEKIFRRDYGIHNMKMQYSNSVLKLEFEQVDYCVNKYFRAWDYPKIYITMAMACYKIPATVRFIKEFERKKSWETFHWFLGKLKDLILLRFIFKKESNHQPPPPPPA